MLCLSRKVGEIVRIGNDFSVRVLSIRGDKVRLGFTAPRDIRVDRDEVREKIERRELPQTSEGEWKETDE